LASVELNQVSKVYSGNVKAISDANLSIADREFVVLVGPSGCGKSTLLRMIAGLEEISSGEIQIDDKVVNNVAPKDRDIAMVFQNYALYPHMSVFDNMAFGLKLRKFPKEEIKQRVLEAAKILDIENYIDRKPKALSGGQRQRVALGRAIVRKPKVFLFDEPLSNLDAKLRVQMRIEINRLHHQLQTTMIYVTHDQIEAMTMGDKIVVLKDGFIQQVDSPLNLYNHPVNKFVAGFIGSPAMNFFQGSLQSENGQLFFQSELFRINLTGTDMKKLKDYSGKEIILGVRPENIFDSTLATGRKLSNPQEIVVDVVEPIGNEIFVYFKGAEQSYCMRMSPEKLHRVGDKIQIGFELEKLHFFDHKSEMRIV
jgi:multiple sugar transport system ATP-binding protein